MKKVRKLLALVMSLAMIMSVVVAPQAANAAIDESLVSLVYNGSADFKIAVGSGAGKYAGYISEGNLDTWANTTIAADNFVRSDNGTSTASATHDLGAQGANGDLYATVMVTPTALRNLGEALQNSLGSNDTEVTVALPLQVMARLKSDSTIVADAQLKNDFLTNKSKWVDVTFPISSLAKFNLTLAATPRPTDPIVDPAIGYKVLTAGPAWGGDDAIHAFPGSFVVTKNPLGQTGYAYTKKAINFLVKDLIPGVEYDWTVRAHRFNTSANDFSSANSSVLATGTIPTSKVSGNQAKIEIDWNGTDVNGDLLKLGSSIFYTVNVQAKKVSFANINTAATVATNTATYTAPSNDLYYEVFEANIPTFTPGTDSNIVVNLGNFNRITMGNVHAVITKSSIKWQDVNNDGVEGWEADDVLAVIENNGTDLIANFKWNGQYTKSADSKFEFNNFLGYYDDEAVSGRPVPKTGDGQYYMYLMTENVDWTNKGEGKIVVGQSGPYLFGTSTKYVNGAGSQIDFLQTKNGRVTFRVEGSNAYLPVTVTVKNNVNEVVHTILATTDANGVVDIPWTGLLADNTNYIADGVYRVEATITNNANTNTKDSILYVGMPVRVIGISTKESVITVGAGNAYTDVELVFNPTTATTRMIKEIKLYNDNNYFTIDGNMKNYTDKTFRILGLKNSEGKTITGLAKVTFMDGNTTDLTLNVNVSKASTGITNVSTILREAAGTTGKKITFEYTPAGTNGEMPTFYPIKKDADGKIIKLEGAELDSANSIATVNEKGEVTFKAPGRVLYGVKFEDQVYDVVICTTTEFIQQLVMYPLDGEVSIKAGLSEDASKQPRVAAYARPVYLADTKVTYTTSDRNAVYFRYAVADASSITNDSANVPAGAYAGALVGVKGEAVITAKSAALTTDSEPLEEQITVTVAE